jgi:hypothetical protein
VTTAIEWIVKDGDEEYRVSSVADLREAARAGRIVAGTYIYHPFRQHWVYAREIDELVQLFGTPAAVVPHIPRGQMVCTNCGFVGNPRMTVQGSGCVELTLWLLLILPGLIYSVWRLSSKRPGCPKCGAPSMIPADSPRARELLMNRPNHL